MKLFRLVRLSSPQSYMNSYEKQRYLKENNNGIEIINA